MAQAVGVKDLKRATAEDTHSGAALIYPKLDRLYQVFNMKQGQDGGPNADSLVLAERDLGSLRLIRTLAIPQRHAWRANGSSGAEWVATFDTAHDRLYLAYKPNNGLNNTVTQNLPGLLGIDLHTHAYTDSTFPNFMVGTADQALNLVGIEFDESSDGCSSCNRRSTASPASATCFSSSGGTPQTSSQAAGSKMRRGPCAPAGATRSTTRAARTSRRSSWPRAPISTATAVRRRGSPSPATRPPSRPTWWSCGSTGPRR